MMSLPELVVPTLKRCKLISCFRSTLEMLLSTIHGYGVPTIMYRDLFLALRILYRLDFKLMEITLLDMG
jgi:hypothetical protein